MAVVFPIYEDAETLRSYAAVALKFSSEDLEQLDSVCTTLIADAKTVTVFVFPTYSSDGGTNASLGLTEGAPPVFHARASASGSTVAAVDARDGDNPLKDPSRKLRQHESMLRDLRQRLHSGRAMLKKINEKYDYGFTVVSFGKARLLQESNSRKEVKNQDVKAMTKDSISENDQKCSTNEIVSDGRNTRDAHRVLDAYIKFMYTFDALHKWAVSVVGILDRDGYVPESGRYVVPREPRHANYLSNGDTRVDFNGIKNNIHSSNVVSSDNKVANVGPETSARLRTVSVTRYEIHNVTSIYHAFETQASLFYAPSYTIYDHRVRKRLLDPAYYQAMRDTLRELGCEIDRLQDLKVELQDRRGTPAIIALHPPLCEFQYLQDTLRLYWSICLMEDDLTSLQYHCLLYTQYVADAGEVMDLLRQQHRSHVRTPNSISTVNTETLSPEERGSLEAGFECFWRVRGKVLELRTSLARNIKEANRTHCYRVAAVPPPPVPPASRVTKSVARRALSTMRAWVNAISCEVDPMVGASPPHPRDDEGVVLSTTSPQSEAKAVLQHHVLRLVAAVEAEASALELEYPGTFYRDTRAKWAGRAGEVIRYLESVSVVFSRPT